MPPQIRQQSEGGYLEFVRTTIPRTWTVDAPHIRLIAEHLDAVERGEIDRLAIQMPPRHSKTETATVRFGVYRMMRAPSENVLITGYNERFARKLGRKARNIALGRIEIDPAKKAADEWATMVGGLLMTRGVGSPPTGTGFGLIIIDDPIRRREDAESEVYREKVWDWYTDDLYTRLEPGGAIVLVMTSWHEDDIGVRAIASEPGRWTVLKLPALAEEGDILGREVGEALWPARWDVAKLARIKEVMSQNEGERSWEALYQQNPRAREGAFFKVSKIEIIDVAPAGLRACRAWDLAATEGGGDFTVGGRVEGPDEEGDWYITDVNRGQWGADRVRNEMRQTAQIDGRSVIIHGPQDPGQAGKDQAAQMIALLTGFNVKFEPVSGNKEVRAAPLAAQVNGGKVKMVRAPWNKPVLEVLRAFPTGKNDDDVDALGDAFIELNTRLPIHELRMA